MGKLYDDKKRLASIFTCSSALASGAGIALARSRIRAFFAASALLLPAALSLQMQKQFAGQEWSYEMQERSKHRDHQTF